MPISSSSSRSSAMRCSADRPRRPNASPSPRTRRTCLPGVTRPSALPRSLSSRRPVWTGRSRASSTSTTCSSKSRSTTEPASSSSSTPVQPSVTACSARYSSAVSPTAAAFSRSGRSLVTRWTSRPSAARFSATARIRWSATSVLSPGGRTDASTWLSSTAQRPALLAAVPAAQRHRLVEPAVLAPQVVQGAQRRPGEPPELRVVALALQLAEHGERQDHLVLVEAPQRPGVAQQDAGVQDVGTRHAGLPARGAAPEVRGAGPSSLVRPARRRPRCPRR